MKSSSDYAWPWANNADEAEAEKLFAKLYPALHTHMKTFESLPGEKPGDRKGLRHRSDRGRFWWEIRSCAYYEVFERPKIVYPDITWTSSFAIDERGLFANNTIYFLPTDDPWIAAVLNAPVGWWRSWRSAQRGKDDALRYFISYFDSYPIPPRPADDLAVKRLSQLVAETHMAAVAIHDWLRLEFGLDQPGRALSAPERLDADGFAAAVRAALPRRRTLSAADIARLKREHADTVEPARRAAAEAARLERRLSDLVNAAYGLTPQEVRLMWDTAPPRMPLAAPAGLG